MPKPAATGTESTDNQTPTPHTAATPDHGEPQGSQPMSNPIPQPVSEARIPVYPRAVKGRFRNIKYGVLALAYGVYFLLPWLRWERAAAPNQAVLFDIPERRFYLFDLVVHPQDIFWLAGFLVIAAMLLFFVTGVAGRVFCGYFCFQTLWTDVFILIERLVQGERPARIRLDNAPWGLHKLYKKTLTHAGWLLVGFATGLTFALYWGNAPELTVQVFTGQAPFPAYATTFFLTATTYLMAGHARELVCTYMCPYARFQSAMFDKDTLIVAYDTARGEGSAGRAKLRRGLRTREERQAQGVGDCVDCGYCVQVCPTGIDIRDGLQLECISCALCIDACDNIMDSLGWPRGLIHYTSERAQQGGKTRVFKPKTIGYGLVLLAAIGLLVWSIAARAPMDMAVYQVRQPLYVTLSDGSVRNSYEIKLNNKTEETVTLKIGLQDLPNATLDLGDIETVALEPEQSLRVYVQVRMPPAREEGRTPFYFVAEPLGQGTSMESMRRKALFYAPGTGTGQ